MDNLMTITLSDEVKSALVTATEEEGVSPDALINLALEEFLFFRRFRSLHEQMVATAQAQGIYTDEDVFALLY